MSKVGFSRKLTSISTPCIHPQVLNLYAVFSRRIRIYHFYVRISNILFFYYQSEKKEKKKDKEEEEWSLKRGESKWKIEKFLLWCHTINIYILQF